MNERNMRIQQLAELAKIGVNNGDGTYGSEIDVQKFADYIINDFIVELDDNKHESTQFHYIKNLRDEIQNLRNLLSVAYTMARFVRAPDKYHHAFLFHNVDVSTLLPIEAEKFKLPITVDGVLTTETGEEYYKRGFDDGKEKAKAWFAEKIKGI